MTVTPLPHCWNLCVSPSDADRPADARLAVIAEVLYLVNLMLAPGLAFLVIALMKWRWQRRASSLVRNHIAQAFAGSIWAGLLLVGVNVLLLSTVGYASPWTWIIGILYFTCCHASLIFCGVVGLSRAISGQPFVFPLIGDRVYR